MNQIKNDSGVLRTALLMDSVASGAMGIGLIVAAGALAPLLGISQTFLQVAGAILVPFTGLLVHLARQRVASEGWTRFVILGNALWVVGSVWVLAARWIEPTPLGTAFVLAQAGAVGVFALLEFRGLRQAQTTQTVTAAL